MQAPVDIMEVIEINTEVPTERWTGKQSKLLGRMSKQEEMDIYTDR